jgi:hypothetical protein
MRAFLLVLLAACNDYPDASSTVDDSTGKMAGSHDCGCIINRLTEFPSVEVDCDTETTMLFDIPAVGVTVTAALDFFYDEDNNSYYGGGNGIVTLGRLFGDPRGAPFDEKYRDFYVESAVLPDQFICDPVQVNVCIQFPRSTLLGAKMYCEEERDGL